MCLSIRVKVRAGPREKELDTAPAQVFIKVKGASRLCESSPSYPCGGVFDEEPPRDDVHGNAVCHGKGWKQHRGPRVTEEIAMQSRSGRVHGGEHGEVTAHVSAWMILGNITMKAQCKSSGNV